MLPLPVSVEGVTRDWLQAALALRDPAVRLRQAKVIDVIRGTSTKIRVHIAGEASEPLPRSLIVKGGFDEHSPAMGPMYATEMRFYRDVAPFVPISSPRCYFAGGDPASHQSIVILEDLRERAVRFCDPLVPQRPDQVARRLRAIATYHARTWNSPEFAPGGRFDWIAGRHEGWSLVYMAHYLEPERWAHYMSLPRAMAVAGPLRDRAWMSDALQSLAHHHRRFVPCLNHGDTHLGNLYEEADGTPGFFDAQVARAPWQFEVAYHLVAALDLADRRAHERELLRCYLDGLKSQGIAPPDWNEAWDAYRREIAYGLFIFLINETRFQPEAVNTAYSARFGLAALDHDTRGLLRGS